MQDIMVDVEALGPASSGVLLQVGAIAFDREGAMTQFDAPSTERLFIATVSLEHIDMASIDPDTLRWWLTKTSDAARISVFTPDGSDEREVLESFHAYLSRLGPRRMICSQPSYDFGHLYGLYERHGRKIPWAFRTEEGTRQVARQAEAIGLQRHLAHNETPHNALFDAIAQARDYTRQWQGIQDRLGVPYGRSHSPAAMSTGLIDNA